MSDEKPKPGVAARWPKEPRPCDTSARERRHVPTASATRGEADLKLMRAVIGFLGGWAACTKACRRARRCASPSVACFDENLESIRDQLEDLAAWPRLDGPREPADLARPVVELFD